MTAVGMLTSERGGGGRGTAGTDVMPRGIALSASLHAGLLALLLFGLPSLFRPPPPPDTPIAVELVTIGPDTRATHPNRYRPQKEARPIPAPAPPAPKPEPVPPQPAAAAVPPASGAPPPRPMVREAAKPEPKAPPPPPPPPKPAFAKAPPLPPEPKPRPEPRQAHDVPRPERKPDTVAFAKLIKDLEEKKPERHPQPASFDALLKNLTKDQTTPAVDAPPAPQHRAAATAPPSSQPRAPLASQLSASEIDLLRQQIERCWDIPIGARDAKDLNIEVKAVINRDGTVRQAAIVNAARYAADPFFRAAADSARRALLDPQCSPLPVPADKYEAWHNLDLTFNPKDLL